MGPRVQSEIRDLGFWRHTKGWDTGRLREAKPSRVSRIDGTPTLAKTVTDFQCVSAQGSLTVEGRGVRRREVLSAGKEATGRFPGHVPV